MVTVAAAFVLHGWQRILILPHRVTIPCVGHKTGNILSVFLFKYIIRQILIT